MPHNTQIEIQGKIFDMVCGLYPYPEFTRLALSGIDIATLSDEELVSCLREFQRDSKEIEAISMAHEGYWDVGMIGKESLELIANGTCATEDQRKRAKEILENLDVPSPQEIKRSTPATTSKEGFVYLILADTGHYKIGRSKSVFDRIKAFGVKLPFEIELIHQFPADDMFAAEAALHEDFAKWRVNGEWFDLTPQMVDNITVLTGYVNGVFEVNI